MRHPISFVAAATLGSIWLGAAGCSCPHKPATAQSSAAVPAAETAQAAAPVPVGPIETGRSMEMAPEFSEAHFALNSAALQPGDDSALDQNAAWLKAHEDVKIELAGHCDQRGTVAYNLGLGERRAAAVRDYYENQGIAGSRIATISYGKELPVCDEGSEDCWSRNRIVMSKEASPSDISAIFASWPPLAQLAARVMIEKNGAPQSSTTQELRWPSTGSWEMIVVHDDAARPLEQRVTYAVPPEKLAAVRRFHHGVKAIPDEGVLSARGESEASNLLALNLAHDIATGKRTAAQADSFYAKTMRLQEAGKSSPYTERLLF